jgi:hypothetical protein
MIFELLMTGLAVLAWLACLIAWCILAYHLVAFVWRNWAGTSSQFSVPRRFADAVSLLVSFHQGKAFKAGVVFLTCWAIGILLVILRNWFSGWQG